jgi:hypothetical protein
MPARAAARLFSTDPRRNTCGPAVRPILDVARGMGAFGQNMRQPIHQQRLERAVGASALAQVAKTFWSAGDSTSGS